MTFASGIRPYSAEERERDHAAKMTAYAREHARQQACPSGQNYHKPLNLRLKRLWDRICGDEIAAS